MELCKKSSQKAIGIISILQVRAPTQGGGKTYPSSPQK